MQYTDNEAALIGGLISNYFFSRLWTQGSANPIAGCCAICARIRSPHLI